MLTDIKNLRKCPLVDGYRCITQKVDAAKICVQQILTIALTNYAKISFKRLYKNLSYLFFFMNFFRHFPNRPYPNVKIILAYFYIIKTI